METYVTFFNSTFSKRFCHHPVTAPRIPQNFGKAIHILMDCRTSLKMHPKMFDPRGGEKMRDFFFENFLIDKGDLSHFTIVGSRYNPQNLGDFVTHTQLVVCLLCSLLDTVHLLYIQSNLENCHRLGSISSALRINQDWRWINRGQ